MRDVLRTARFINYTLLVGAIVAVLALVYWLGAYATRFSQ
jgi:hypothetical protein